RVFAKKAIGALFPRLVGRDCKRSACSERPPPGRVARQRPSRYAWSMEKKHGVGLLVVVAVAAFFGWPYLQWFRFELEVRDAIGDKRLGRAPGPEAILAFPEELAGLAKAHGFDALKVTQAVRERGMGPTSFWYLEVQLSSGPHAF